MNIIRSSCIVALFLSLSGAAFAGHEHPHGHDTPSPSQLQLDAGKKWATDAPLRQAMSGINEAMSKALPLIHRQQFSDEQYRALAYAVNQQIAFAVENCKLNAKADAMLHLVIADLAAGAETLSGGGGKDRHDGAVQIMQGLKAYGQFFQHPGWRLAKG